MEQQNNAEAVTDRKEKVFETAVLAGEILLESGAEIIRVEDTMRRIAAAYELENFDIYVVTSGLFASADGDEHNLYSRIKGVPNASPHFGKIDGVNDVSRRLVGGQNTIEEAYAELCRIRELPIYPTSIRTLGAGMGAMGFCYFLGGTVKDSLMAFLSGFLMWIMVAYFRKWGIKKALCNVAGSAAACALCIFFYQIGLGDSLDKMTIGALIPLIPGVSFVNGIRDLSDNNFISGMVRLLDVAMVTTCMAIGSGIIMELARRIGVML